MDIIKCAAHYYTVDFTRLLVSANTNTDDDELAFIERTFYVDIIKCTLHYYTVDFTRLLVSANNNIDSDDLHLYSVRKRRNKNRIHVRKRLTHKPANENDTFEKR